MNEKKLGDDSISMEEKMLELRAQDVRRIAFQLAVIGVKKFYNLLHDNIIQNNITGKIIFNVDEFAIGVVSKCLLE